MYTASTVHISLPALAAFPIATVATGIPFGICTIDSRESLPLRMEVLMGTPTTGRLVRDATMPGRCAAPYHYIAEYVDDYVQYYEER